MAIDAHLHLLFYLTRDFGMETRSLQSVDSLITIKKRGFFLEKKKEKKNKSVLFSVVLVAKQLKGNEASFFFYHAEDCVWTEWDDVVFFKVRIETKSIRTQNNFSTFYLRQKIPSPGWGRCFPYCWLVIGCSNVIQSTIFTEGRYFTALNFRYLGWLVTIFSVFRRAKS